MAQEKILVRELSGGNVKVVPEAGEETTKELKSGVGTLAIGKVGDITSKAFGPIAPTVTLGEEKEIGTLFEDGDFVGVLANGNDIANTAAKFNTSLKVAAGQTVSVLQYGTMVIKGASFDAIAAKMNARVIYGAKTDEVCEIELTGKKATA